MSTCENCKQTFNQDEFNPQVSWLSTFDWAICDTCLPIVIANLHKFLFGT